MESIGATLKELELPTRHARVTPLGCTLCAVCLIRLRDAKGKAAASVPPYLPLEVAQSITSQLTGGNPFFAHRNNSVEELSQDMVDKIFRVPAARLALDLAEKTIEGLRLAKEGGLTLQLHEANSSISWLDSLETLSSSTILARYKAFLYHVEQSTLDSSELSARLSLSPDSVERWRASGFKKLEDFVGYQDTNAVGLRASFKEDVTGWFVEPSILSFPTASSKGAVFDGPLHQDVLTAVHHLVEAVVLNSTPASEKLPLLPRLSFFESSLSLKQQGTGDFMETTQINRFPSSGLLFLSAFLASHDMCETSGLTRDFFAETSKSLCEGLDLVCGVDWKAGLSILSSSSPLPLPRQQKVMKSVPLSQSVLLAPSASPLFNYPVIPLPLHKDARGSLTMGGGKDGLADFYAWATESPASDKSRGIRGLFADALLASSLPGPHLVRKQHALSHEAVLRALAHILAHCMLGPCVSEQLSDGARVNFTGNCLISQISPAVKTHSGFPLALQGGEKGTGPPIQSDLAHSMRTVSDLVKELGCGIISTFNKDGLHGSRAIGITEFGRSRIYDLAGLPLPPFKLTTPPSNAPSGGGFRGASSPTTAIPMTPPHPLPSKPTSSQRSPLLPPPSLPSPPPTSSLAARGVLEGRQGTSAAIPENKAEEGRLASPPMDLSSACESGKDDLLGDRSPEAIAAAVAHGCARAGCHVMQPKVCQWLIKRRQWPCSDMSLQRRALATILERHASEYVAQFLGGGGAASSPSDDGVKHYVGCKPGVTVATLPLWKSRGVGGGGGGGEAPLLSAGGKKAAALPASVSVATSTALPPLSVPDDKAMLLIHFFGYVSKRAAETVNSAVVVKDGPPGAPVSGLAVGKPHVSVSAHAVAVDIRVPLVEMGERASMDRMWVSPDNESPPCAKLVAFLRSKALEGFLEVDMEYPQLPTAKLGEKGVSAFIKSYLQHFATSVGKPTNAYSVSDAACTTLGVSMGVIFPPPPPVFTRFTTKNSTSRAAKKQLSAAAAAASTPSTGKGAGVSLPSKPPTPSRPAASSAKSESSAPTPLPVEIRSPSSPSSGQSGGPSLAGATSESGAWGAPNTLGAADWGRNADKQAGGGAQREPPRYFQAPSQTASLSYAGEVFHPQQTQSYYTSSLSNPGPAYDSSVYPHTPSTGQYFGSSAPQSHFSSGGWGSGVSALNTSGGTWNGGLSTAAASSVTVDPRRYTDSFSGGGGGGGFSSPSHPGQNNGGLDGGNTFMAPGRNTNTLPWNSVGGASSRLGESWMDVGQSRDALSDAAANAAASEAASAASSRSRFGIVPPSEHAFGAWGGSTFSTSYKK